MVIVEGGDGDQLTEKGKTRNDRNISDGGEEDDVKFALAVSDMDRVSFELFRMIRTELLADIPRK